jgi:hypothetical protein
MRRQVETPNVRVDSNDLFGHRVKFVRADLYRRSPLLYEGSKVRVVSSVILDTGSRGS